MAARCPARVGIPAVGESALPDVVPLANFGAGGIVGDIVGSSWSWWWAKACEWWAFSGQLLARVPKGVVSAKGAVTANGTIETKGVILLELSILSWMLDGITKGRSLVTDFWGVCMCWGEGIHKDLIVQAIPCRYASCPAAWWNRRLYSMHALGVNCLKSIAMRVWYFTRDNAMSVS